MAPSTPAPMYRIQQIPSKGRGLIASRNITRGERIFSESPFFIFPNIEETTPTIQVFGPKVQALDTEQRGLFEGLYNNFRYYGVPASIGIIKTNALRVDHETDAVFPTFSIINHSCLPNASYSWNGNIMKGTLHAIRKILAGDEITIAYGDHGRGSEGQFSCLCPLCTKSDGAELAMSDTRRKEMLELEDEIWQWGRPRRNPEEFLRLCYNLECRLREEYDNAPTPAVAEVYEFAAGIAARHSDAGRVIAFMKWAYAVRCICEGEDNPNTQKCALRMEDARAHPKWGRTQWWGAQLERPPTYLPIEEYVNWVWRWGR
ncbi:hypothetical protein ONS95_000716 [Cadophora gregata]|uniref:uncharacterized protein n=1 Tax=Cadophora gregata TaxID=51156 RepID=UPI0026DC07E3|nr:uncharacterized protein ONS95_000716 [Cadophora gregata]KAK0103108.1 hypothetical protein ONS96_005717 [Cadophora gregata f. sp. sojae]KAK0128765.1 hypothetical protein ONS95_000716 [Cadophora gregata]